MILTTPPSVSAMPAAETAGGNNRWSRCWRRFHEQHHRGRRSESEPPLGVGCRKPTGRRNKQLTLGTQITDTNRISTELQTLSPGPGGGA